MLSMYPALTPSKPLKDPVVLILTGIGAQAAAAAMNWLFPSVPVLHVKHDRVKLLLGNLDCVRCDGEPILVVWPEESQSTDISELAERFGARLIEVREDDHPALTINRAVWIARNELGIW